MRCGFFYVPLLFVGASVRCFPPIPAFYLKVIRTVKASRGDIGAAESIVLPVSHESSELIECGSPVSCCCRDYVVSSSPANNRFLPVRFAVRCADSAKFFSFAIPTRAIPSFSHSSALNNASIEWATRPFCPRSDQEMLK